LTVHVAGQPRGELWSTIGGSEAILSALTRAVRRARAQVPAGGRVQQLASVLVDAGVDALAGGFARGVANLGRADHVPLWVRDLVTAFGSAEPGPLGIHQPAEGIRDGPLALLDAADVQPTIEIVVERAFREQRADQHREVCLLLAALRIVQSAKDGRTDVEAVVRDLPPDQSLARAVDLDVLPVEEPLDVAAPPEVSPREVTFALEDRTPVSRTIKDSASASAR